MVCEHWKVVILVLVLPLYVQGHEACYYEKWTYHSHTHSCFQLIQIHKKWTDAQTYCSQVKLGSNYGVTTHLAKIDDNETNSFIVTDLFPKRFWRPYIGLHKACNKDFRWDGYLNETLKFEHARWYDQHQPYVTIEADAWRGQPAGMTRQFLCQHTAKKMGRITCQQQSEDNGIKFTCYSNLSPKKALLCRWTYKYHADNHYQEWIPISDISHQSHSTDRGLSSYKSTCSFTLSNIKSGIVTVKMEMYPNISNMDLMGNEKASTGWELDINIHSDSSSSLSTGAIVGLILASTAVVIVLTVIAMIAFRRLREKRNSKSSHENENGRTDARFQEPEVQEGPSDSGSVEVTYDAMGSGRDIQSPTRYVSENGAYGGDEQRDSDDVQYETIKDEERAKRNPYEVLRWDDPNYNREPLRQYVTIDPECTSTRID